MGLAGATLVHDFGFLGADGEAEILTCPREPVASVALMTVSFTLVTANSRRTLTEELQSVL